MKRSTLSILFFIRRTRKLRNEEVPIYLRITVDRERSEVSVKRSINPDHWNESKGCVKRNTSHALEINSYLDQIKFQIQQHQQDLEKKNKAVTASSLKRALLNTEDDNEVKTVLKVYEEHNADMKLRIGNGVTKATYTRHETSRRNLERFITSKYKMTDYYLKDVDHQFIVKYETFLRVTRNCNNNSTVKYIRNLGKIIKMSLENEWIKNDPMRKIKLHIEEVDKPFLNMDEINSILNKKFVIPRIAQVRDVFLFCCFTGLAFVDVKSLSRKDIEMDSEGNSWIKKQRQKSRQWAHIPLLPVANQIIEHYASNAECLTKGVLLPVLSNQKMNAYLKEVADLCGITKNLTTHCARHTFATTVTLANGIAMENVSRMLGHASLNMTKKYARILDSTIGKEMSQLADKLQFQMN